MGPDAKVIARVESDGTHWQPKHVSISLNHHQGSDWFLLREIAEEAVAIACAGKGLPDIDLNGAGMFVSGGPNGDNGLSGKKLVVDAYGPTVPIGGGAWSGKDLNKVDRLGGYLARRIALREVQDEKCQEALVTLEYIPGCDAPVRVDVLRDGVPTSGRANLTDIGSNKAEVTARNVWELDPFAQIEVWDKGVNRETIERFVGSPKLSVMVDEMDDIAMKFNCRFECKKLHIPVVMATDNGDGMILDVERFDQEPERPLFHGRVEIPQGDLTALNR